MNLGDREPLQRRSAWRHELDWLVDTVCDGVSLAYFIICSVIGFVIKCLVLTLVAAVYLGLVIGVGVMAYRMYLGVW